MASLLVVPALALFCGLLLGYAYEHWPVSTPLQVAEIEAILPQTQCGQCGYPGCKLYAEAVSQGEVINKCVPGGHSVIGALQLLMGPEAPLSNQVLSEVLSTVVLIDESRCIGCTKCFKICPIDAIVGSKKFLHTVLSEQCTGCGLCLSVCPTRCITVQTVSC